MVSLKDVQGRIYKFKSKSECFSLGMPALDVANVVRNHKVLVLDIVRGKLDHVKVMTVSTQKSKKSSAKISISRLPRR